MPIGQFTVAQWRKLTGWLNDGLLPRHLLTDASNSPAVAGEAGLGTSAPAPSLSWGTDTAGKIVFGTGTSPTGAVILTITFSKAYSQVPVVILTAYNDDHITTGLGLGVNNVSTTGFSIYAASAPAGGTSVGAYGFSYLVIGR